MLAVVARCFHILQGGVMKWLVAIATGLTLLTLAPSAAFANEDMAKQLYQKAQERYRNNQFEKAATLLDEAYAEDPKVVYQYNRIRALEGAEKYEKALKVLETYEADMRESGEYPEIPELKKSLQARIAKEDTEPKPVPDRITRKPAETPDDETEDASEKAAPEDTQPETKTDNEVTDTEPTDQIPPPPTSNTKTKIGWSLLGVSGVLYGTAAFFGSYLPYKQGVRERLSGGGSFTSQEIRSFKTNRALSIGAIALGTATLVGGSWLVLSKTEPSHTTFSIGPGNVSVRIRF